MNIVRVYTAAALLALGMVLVAHAAEESHSGIRNAIATLEQTKEGLKNGEHGFGGHRSKAIEHIDAAEQELRQALAFADPHPEEIKAPGKP